MPVSIEALNVQISADATAAEKSIDALTQTLTRLKSITKGGVGLTTVAKQFGALKQSVQGLDATALNNTVNALTKIKNLQGLKGTGISSVSKALSNLGSSGTDLKNVYSGLQKVNTVAPKAQKSFTDVALKVGLLMRTLNGAANVVKNWIGESNDYIETLNLFEVSMGKFANEAKRYAESVSELTGIDPAEWMRGQGVFMTIAEGFGIASDRAYIMSKNLTQLGYDLSSFFNISTKGETGTMNKLMSGISGELEPLRRLGYDLSQVRLEAVATELGLKKKFKAMTQAEKAQLRYYAIMTQVTKAQGDMARTLDTPANQLRILQAQLTMAGRALGELFIPMLNNVIPVLIAVAKAVKTLASAIAALFGFTSTRAQASTSNSLVSMSESFSLMGEASGVEAVSSDMKTLDDGISQASKDAKELKNYLMGFDELNVIDTSRGADGGGGGGGAGGDGAGSGGDWEWELPEYNFLEDIVNSSVDKIMAKIQPAIDWATGHAQGLLNIALAIGEAILAWKLANALLPNLSTFRADLTKISSLAISIATLVVSVKLSYKFTTDYLKEGDAMSLVAQGLTSILSSAIIGKVIAGAFGAGAGKFAAATSLIVNGAVTIKAVLDNVDTKGLKGSDVAASLWGALQVGLGAGGVALALGACFAGAGVAAAITFVVAALVSIGSAAMKKAGLMGNAAKWGDVTASAKEMQTLVESMFTFDVPPKINLVTATISDLTSAKTSLNEIVAGISADLNAIMLTPDVNTSSEMSKALAEKINGEGGLIDGLNATLETGSKTAKILIDFVPPKSSTGGDLSEGTLGDFMSSDTQLSSYAKSIGEQINNLIAEGFDDANAATQKQMLDTLTNNLIEISSALTTGRIQQEFAGSVQLLLSSLTEGSLEEVLAMYRTEEEALRTKLEEAATTLRGEYGARLAAYEEERKQLIESGKTETDAEVVALSEAIEAMKSKLAQFDIAGTVEGALTSATAPAKQMWIEELQKIFIEPLTNPQLAEDLGLGFAGNIGTALSGEVPVSELSTNISTMFEHALDRYVNDPVLLEAMETFGISGWELLSEDTQSQIFDAVADALGDVNWSTVSSDMQKEIYSALDSAVGSETAQALWKKLGLEIPAGFAEGIEEGKTTVTNAMTNGITKPAMKAVKDNMEIASPSKVMFEMGEYTIQGMINGINSLQLALLLAIGLIMAAVIAAVAFAWTTIRLAVPAAWSDINAEITTSSEAIKTTLTSASEGWETAVSDAWSAIKSGVTTGWGGINSKLYSQLGVVKNTLSSGLSTIKGTSDRVWSSMGSAAVGMFSEIASAANRMVSGVASALNRLGSAVSNFRRDTESALSKTAAKIKGLQIPQFAMGGMPDRGQLFVAREAGAELVGSIGNRTAVANNDQIVAGIYEGVVQAMRDSQGADGRVTEVNVYLDGRQITAAVEATQRNRGATVYPGGVVYGT